MQENVQSAFREKGYYLAKQVFNANELAELEKDFDRIVHQLNNTGEQTDATWTGAGIDSIKRKDDVIFHTHNVQQYSRIWLNAMLHEKLLSYASAILGDDVILHHSKLFQKPAEKGSPFPMHQDWSYFPTIHDSMIAAVIHVSDATDEMGCFRVYEESHKLGRMEGSNGQHSVVPKNMEAYPIDKAKVLEAAAGDVLFFHYFTLHGSMPNTSSRTRKTVLLQMYAGNDSVEDGVDHPDERLVLKGWNHVSSRKRAGARK